MAKRAYDLIVLGGGTGGLVSAHVAAAAGARVALVERERTGGDCLWTGCVPSKSLIAAADLAHGVCSAADYGLAAELGPVDLDKVMERVRRVIATIEPEDSPARLRAAGVEVIQAQGTFTGPHALTAEGRELRFRSAIIATGAAPVVPAIPGLEGSDVVTSDSVWRLRRLPRRLVVLGGGPVGCELGQAFARLGSDVTLADMAERLLTREQADAAAVVGGALADDGVAVRTGARAVEVRRDDDGAGRLVIESADGRAELGFDALLVAVGRRPRVQGIGLDAVGAATGDDGALAVGHDLRAGPRHVFGVGDVTAAMPFTHVAAHHARVATINALFGARRKVDSVLPRVTFTRPELAQVGLTLDQAREHHGDRVTCARYELSALDRAITDGRTAGFCELVGDRRGRLMGATVVGAAAGEVVAELVARVKNGDRIDSESTTVHAYPTMSEGPARAADDYLREKYARPLPAALARGALALRRLRSPRPG